jgi:hypothetical protein
MKTLPLAIALLFSSPLAFADGASQVSGGVCASQGNWLQAALEQSNLVVNAINTLKDDPNCKALYGVLNDLPQSQNLGKLAQDNAAGDALSFSGYFRELQTVNQFLRPSDEVVAQGLKGTEIKSMVQYLTFRKSLDAITAIQAQSKYATLSADQKGFVDGIGAQMQGFLAHTKQVADLTMSTSTSIMAALPKSQMCFSKNPGAGLTVFSSLVATGASMVTGGQISKVGPFIANVMSFNREMKFVKNLRGVEYEKYKLSISCLVESTQESYCSLQDAQDALDFFKGSDGKSLAGNQATYDPMKNPMGGMIVLLRDVPNVSGWLQKILFGMDPKTKVESEAKDTDWDSFLGFVKARNDILGTFQEMKKIYRDSADTNGAKFAQIKVMITKLNSSIGGNNRSGGINFFSQGMDNELIPFFLMGRDQFPEGYSSNTLDFNTFYSTWTSGSGGNAASDNAAAKSRDLSLHLNDPDALLATIEARVRNLIDQASQKSTSYFSTRMVVDPQNLILTGMAGPGVSPYRSLNNLRAYLKGLIVKLNESKLILAKSNDQQIDLTAYATAVPTIEDTVNRLDRIMDAMGHISKLQAGSDSSTARNAALQAMDIVYDSADMFSSHDAFLTARIEIAVRMDITDTIWRHSHMNENQDELLASSGKDVIARLSRYFSDDPVVQRLDISSAAPVMDANLKAVENLFAPVIWQSIRDLDCQLKGGQDCAVVPANHVPVGQSPSIFDQIGDTFNPHLGAAFSSITSLFSKPTSDSKQLENLKAKLCIQSLGFESRDRFRSICQGSILLGEMAVDRDPLGLNADYNNSLRSIQATLAGSQPGKLTAAKSMGVCSLRSYIRRNYIHRMYQDYNDEQN